MGRCAKNPFCSSAPRFIAGPLRCASSRCDTLPEAQQWTDLCADLRHAPKVLAVGDLHVGSFGTWRDAEGRLCRGVDDFEESWPLPYTNDLVRLTASAKIVADLDQLSINVKDSCDVILDSWVKWL